MINMVISGAELAACVKISGFDYEHHTFTPEKILGNVMRIISGLIRVVTGLAVMGMALFVYLSNLEQLSGSKEVTLSIMGLEITALPQQIIIGLCFAGAAGLVIEFLGVWTLARKPASEQMVK
jgi:hypothetical protein